MRIAVGADQRGDADAIAADIADEIAEDRKAGDDVEAILRIRRKGSRKERQTSQPKETPHHGYASRWRPGNICLTRPLTLPNSSDAIYNAAATRMIAGPEGIRV